VEAQSVRQTPAPHAYGAHDTFVGVTHMPLPLHVDAGVSVDPVHVEAAQIVPAAYRRQAPLPLQEPSVPHIATP